MMSEYLAVISCGSISAFVFGEQIFFIYEGLTQVIVLNISVYKIGNLLISIVVVPLFLIQFP